jgi:hypothetical protein
MDHQTKLNKLILKRAMLVSNLDSLYNPLKKYYQKLGKVEANIVKVKREMLSNVKNIFHED